MTKIVRTVAYLCEYCQKEYFDNKTIITISGQWDGRSDMDYEFHFCNECLKKEIEKHKDDTDYVEILKYYIKRGNIKMKTLKEKLKNAYDDIPSQEQKPLYQYYLKQDVEQAVLEFENFVKQEIETKKEIDIKLVMLVFIEIFGEFKK